MSTVKLLLAAVYLRAVSGSPAPWPPLFPPGFSNHPIGPPGFPFDPPMTPPPASLPSQAKPSNKPPADTVIPVVTPAAPPPPLPPAVALTRPIPAAPLPPSPPSSLRPTDSTAITHPAILTPPADTPTGQLTSYADVKETTVSALMTASSSAALTSATPDNVNMANHHGGSQGFQPNRTLIITLSTVLSVVGLLVIGISIWCCVRLRRGHKGPFGRGITPIDDEEIESWKTSRQNEKTAPLATAEEEHSSAASIKKPPSVIIYQNSQNQYDPHMSEELSPGSSWTYKKSFEGPQTPVLARAPNSRPGLTDETVQGDAAFIYTPKRHPSRLSKLPPGTPRHSRTRSARSSISGGSWRDQDWYTNYTADGEITPRTSVDATSHYPRISQTYDRKHRRVYSSSSVPPRLSLDDEVFLGGLSPRPLLRHGNIGQAIG